jgi:hypothetical protein
MQSGEIMTVMEIHRLELWVLRTHEMMAHSAGTGLRLLRAGPRKGLVASQLNLNSGSIGPSDTTLPVQSVASIRSGDYLLVDEELVLRTPIDRHFCTGSDMVRLRGAMPPRSRFMPLGS